MAETTAPQTTTALSVMTGVSLAFMILRYFLKQRYGKMFGWDDFILALSWVCLLLYSVVIVVSCQYGIGRHVYEIPTDSLKTALKLLHVGQLFGIVAIAISKTSFCVTLFRLATKRWQVYLLWFIIVSLNAVMWLCGIFQFVQCSPATKLWDLVPPGTCWDTHILIDYAILAGSYSAAMDFLLAIFPWLLIWKLRIRTAEKIGVAVTMSLGVLAGITAAFKTSCLVNTGLWVDFTYSSKSLLIWTASETAVTIIAVSIPFLRFVAKEVSNRSRKPTLNGSRWNNHSTGRGRLEDTAAPISGRVALTVPTGRHDHWIDTSILGDMRDKDVTITQANKTAIVYVEGQDGSGNSTLE